MKLAAFALSAVALAASTAGHAPEAQPSTTNVTLYGIADAYMQFANDASNLTRAQSGDLSGSRQRTNLYTALTRFKNDGDSYANRWASAVPAGLTTVDDRNITEFTAGIRHSF